MAHRIMGEQAAARVALRSCLLRFLACTCVHVHVHMRQLYIL